VEGTTVEKAVVTPKAGKSKGDITVYYELVGSGIRVPTVPQLAGRYAVTFDVEAVSGWTAARGLYAGVLEITRPPDPTKNTPTLADFDIVESTLGTFNWDGSSRSATINQKAGKDIVFDTMYTSGASTATKEPPSAKGAYAVLIVVSESAAWNAVTLVAGTINITDPAARNPSINDFNITGIGGFIYDGAGKTVTVTGKTGASAGTPITYLYTNDATNQQGLPVDVGTYSVTFTVPADTANNWNAVTLNAGKITISPRTPVFSDYTVGVIDERPDQSTVLEGVPTPVNFNNIMLGVISNNGPLTSPGAKTILYNGEQRTTWDVGVTYNVTFNVAAVTPNWSAAGGFFIGTMTPQRDLKTPTQAQYTWPKDQLTQSVMDPFVSLNVTRKPVPPAEGGVDSSPGAISVFYAVDVDPPVFNLAASNINSAGNYRIQVRVAAAELQG